MKKQQLYTRLGPDVVERVIRRFNEREMSLQDAVDALGVGKTQVYNLDAAGEGEDRTGDAHVPAQDSRRPQGRGRRQ